MKPVQLNYITKEYIAQFLPENPTILEAGAHKGKDTLALHNQWPESTIYAFEPVPELFEILKNTTAHIPSIHTYNYALSNAQGTRILYQCTGKIDAASSLFKPGDYFQEKPVHFNPIQVPVTTIDLWATQHTITYVDFLWLDLQGGELDLLHGAETLLKTVKVIHTEVNLIERYKSIPLYPTIKNYLAQYGFRPQAEALYKTVWGNVLFVKESQ